MRLKQVFYGISMEIYGIVDGISDWDFYGIPKKDFHDVSMIFLWDYYGIPGGDFHGILLDFYDMTMGLKQGFYAIPMMFL